MVRHVRRHALEKRGIKTVVGGTFYIIPTDHLLDRTAALTGKTVKRAGIKSTAIADWKKVRRSPSLASCVVCVTDVALARFHRATRLSSGRSLASSRRRSVSSLALQALELALPPFRLLTSTTPYALPPEPLISTLR